MESKGKVLFVDDEINILKSIRRGFLHAPFEVITAESGEAALTLVESEPFDLALVDLKLPGIDGLAVLEVIKQRWPDRVVIVLTAHASLETAVEALRQGAHDYLFKPCKTLELRDSIRRGLLERQKAQQQRRLLHQLEQHLSSSLQDLRASIDQEPALTEAGRSEPPAPLSAALSPSDDPAPEEGRFLQLGDLIVDLTRHVITLNEQLLELSPTEFSLLAYLVSEAPRVVPPQELVREVQGYQSEQWEAREIVRYHIYRLRQKVKAATGQKSLIKTVRGVGYTINET